jgi:excisionase family DNA binding protein
MSSFHTAGVAPAILRMKPAAEYIGVSRAFLYQLVERGELLRIRLGGRAAGIRRSDLDAWVNEQAAR